MTQMIIYPNGDGVAIVIPTGAMPVDEVARKDVPKGALFKIVDENEIPGDRDFRDAWEFRDGIVVSMDKAREITRARLRRERAPLMEALDVAYMRAMEANDAEEMDRIVAEKNRLRDITELPAISAAETTAELKAITV